MSGIGASPYAATLMGLATAADRNQGYTDALRAAEIALDDRLRANVPGPAPRLEESRVYGVTTFELS